MILIKCCAFFICVGRFQKTISTKWSIRVLLARSANSLSSVQKRLRKGEFPADLKRVMYLLPNYPIHYLARWKTLQRLRQYRENRILNLSPSSYLYRLTADSSNNTYPSPSTAPSPAYASQQSPPPSASTAANYTQNYAQNSLQTPPRQPSTSRARIMDRLWRRRIRYRRRWWRGWRPGGGG